MLRAANTNLVGEMRPRTNRQSCQAAPPRPPTTTRLDAREKDRGSVPIELSPAALALALARLAEVA